MTISTLSLWNSDITEEDKNTHYDAIVASTRQLEADILEAEIELAETNPTIH